MVTGITHKTKHYYSYYDAHQAAEKLSKKKTVGDNATISIILK
jgi:hypothetical protein